MYTDSAHIVNSGVLDVAMSDHLPIFLVRKKIRNKIGKHTTMGRSYLAYNKERFGELLAHQDWTIFDQSRDVNLKWECFEGNITRALDIVCPIRKITVFASKPDWLNNEIIEILPI